jgi:hypothetical protein
MSGTVSAFPTTRTVSSSPAARSWLTSTSVSFLRDDNWPDVKRRGDGAGSLLCTLDGRYIDALDFGVLQNSRELAGPLVSGWAERRVRGHGAAPFRTVSPRCTGFLPLCAPISAICPSPPLPIFLKECIPKSEAERRGRHGSNQDSNQAVRIDLLRHPGTHENEPQPNEKNKVD